jgi:sigma-54 specific flagellar transcriptional regulator A
LFLDEVGEMPLRTQVKLLRVLEAGVIERVGGEREITVDVRLVAATNVPLELAVQARTFRADLYHRLAVLRVHMPPLRERRDDIPLLVAYFLNILNRRYRRDIQRVAPEALALLAEYPWPGNIRELRNVLERAYVETRSSVIELAAFEEWAYEQSQHFPGHWHSAASQNPPLSLPIAVSPYPAVYRALPPRAAAETAPTIDIDPSSIIHLDSAPPGQRPPLLSTGPRGPRVLTRQGIVQAYAQAAGNIAEAARLLGVHRATLYRRLQALGMTRDDLERLTDTLPPTHTRSRDGTTARAE